MVDEVIHAEQIEVDGCVSAGLQRNVDARLWEAERALGWRARLSSDLGVQMGDRWIGENVFPDFESQFLGQGQEV